MGKVSGQRAVPCVRILGNIDFHIEEANTLNVIGAILIGGKSSRMGRDKAQLLLQDGHTLVEHMTRLLESIGGANKLRDIVLSGNLKNYASIPDVIPNKGPLGGIYSLMLALGFKHPEPLYLLVVPVDMPNLTPLQLEQLVSNITPEALVIQHKGFELPAVFRISNALQRTLHERIINSKSKSDLSLRSLVCHLASVEPNSVVQLPATETSHLVTKTFLNTNTPTEWNEFINGANNERQII